MSVLFHLPPVLFWPAQAKKKKRRTETVKNRVPSRSSADTSVIRSGHKARLQRKRKDGVARAFCPWSADARTDVCATIDNFRFLPAGCPCHWYHTSAASRRNASR